MQKKIPILLLAGLACACLLGACGQSTPNSSPSTDTESSTIVNKYTITFKDEAGEVLHTAEVEEGKIPAYTYEKQDTAEWDYTVLGWSATQDGEVLSTLPAATENATYYAKVEQKKCVYTVTYISEGETLNSVSLEYGESLDELPTAARDGYNFVCWCTDSALTNAVELPIQITGNVQLYAKWNEKINITAYLESLLSGYELNPFSYIPETMTGMYSANLISPDDIVSDYTSNVSVSNILSGGFGEQWNMVLDNLHQSMTFFNSLTVVEGLITTSVATFNDYIDKNPSETARHSFMSGVYSVTIDFDGEIIAYALDYTIGEQSAQIYLAMDIESSERVVRIQLGDANALTYTMTENSYEFAIKYLGVRRAYFSISRDKDGNCTGHIYEHLSYEGVGLHSAADFYITDKYVSVVGNKADAFIGSTGYIDEIYNVETGKMLGYEIRETTKALVEITFNTLWFNLDQINGINSIRYKASTGEEAAAFYVNGSSKAWDNMTVGGFGGKMLSRRFDIEFRTQYFYSYNATENTYTKHAVQVPMFFVQEENFETLVEDVKKTNNVQISVNINDADLNKIQADYDKYVDVFIANKDLVTEDVIVAYIGDKIVFA